MANPGVDFSSIVFFGDSLTDNGNLFRLTGFPPGPFYNKRFTDGVTYAEVAPGLLGIADAEVTNFAYGGARSITNTADLVAIDLNDQLREFAAKFPGGAPDGTAAAIYIGNNDYLNYRPATPPTQAEVAQFVGSVVSNIAAAVQTLLVSGVDKVLLFTLPNITFTPFAVNTLSPEQIAGANAIIDGHNAAIAGVAAQFAGLGVNIEIVDTNKFTNEIGADAETFGFTAPLSVPVVDGNGQLTGITNLYQADEIAFFDGVHPTGAAHGVTAAFVAASIAADKVTFSTSAGDVISGVPGRDVIFSGAGNDRINAGDGNDVAFGGTGNDRVFGGDGNDVLSGGSGNDRVFGGDGVDVVAGNAGDDRLFGGEGDDVLIAGRGNDRMFGDDGNDRFYITDEAGVRDFDVVDGGSGHDVLRIEVSEAVRNSREFTRELNRFANSDGDDSFAFRSIGLEVHDIERIEILVNGQVVKSVGAAAPTVTDAQAQAIASADLWGFL